jgi:NhaP-type Na+/H+ or K+/H+ antiporter
MKKFWRVLALLLLIGVFILLYNAIKLNQSV